MTRPVPSVMNYFCSFYNPSTTTYLPTVNVKEHLDANPCPSDGIAKAANGVKNSKQGEGVWFVDFTRGEWVATPLHPIDPEMGHTRLSDLEMCRSTPEDSFLQLAMADRIKEIVAKKNIQGVQVMDQYGAARDCLVTGKLGGVKSESETRDWIKTKNSDEQRALANKLICLVKEVGFASATFETIRINAEGEFFILNTRSYGLFVEEGAGRSHGHSVEKCARVGLFNLHRAVDGQEGLEEFAKEVKSHYDKSLSDYSWTRIILSILCPLIPLVFLIISIYKTCVIKSVADSDNPADLNKYYDEIENVLF